jgi:lipoprotein NlpI
MDIGSKGDLPGAISDFNQAIKVDPNYAPAYQWRGHALSLMGRLDEAITDYTQALNLDPKFVDSYYDRGVARAEKSDFDGALADFSQAIALNPKYTDAYYNRGHVKYFNGDLTGALADLNQAITISPNPPLPYFIRGLIRFANDDREGAASDFEQSATNGYPDAAFWLWIVRMKTGQHGVAQSELSDSLNKPQLFKPGSGPKPIGDFLLGTINQDQLLTGVKSSGGSPEHLCAVWFYIGMTKRFAGDSKGASDSFQQAVVTGAKTYEMYIEAQRQIADLQKS